jgi:dTDP-4-dehydrorhamnose 3,5-epimerase
MDNSRILILGANGQLGTALRAKFPEAKCVDRDEFDITDREAYEKYDWSAIDVVINAAAYTAVDDAETAEGRLSSWQLNATAVGLMTDVANMYNLTLVHISSDYVFDGSKESHTEDEAFSPLGVYGQSKAAGDIAAARAKKHFTLRTSWVIGEGKNFVRTMKSLAEKGVKPKVVGDQFGRLTFTTDLSDAIAFLLNEKAPYGTYNVTNEGDIVSWAQIAQEVFIASGAAAADVTSISTDEYFTDKPEAAPRPLNSTLALNKIKKLGFAPRDWRVGLEDYMKEMK